MRITCIVRDDSNSTARLIQDTIGEMKRGLGKGDCAVLKLKTHA